MYISTKPENVYPYKIGRFRADNPGTSFPVDLSAKHYEAFGVFPVKPTPKPSYDKATQGLDETAENVGGEYVQVWTIRPATQAEIDSYALEQRAIEDDQVKATAKLDATIRFLVTHTDAEIVAKVNAEVTSIASAKVIIGKLAIAVGALARKELRD